MNRPSGQAREHKREVRRNSKLSLKDILSAPGEPIAENAFDYTEVPFRLSQEPGVLKYDAHKRCSAFRDMRWPEGLRREFALQKTEKESNEELRDVERVWIAFLYNELVSACAPKFAIRQLKTLLREPPDKSGKHCYQLSCIPISGASLKYEIVNEAGIPDIDLCVTIRSIGWEVYRESLEAVERIRAEHQQNVIVKEGKLEPDTLFIHYLSAWSRKAACLSIANAWVIHGKVFIPHVRYFDWAWAFNVDRQGPPMAIDDFLFWGNCIPFLMRSTISAVLLEKPMTVSNLSATFYVKEQIVEEYLWAKVVHLPTPCAREHFRYNFLHPDDEILEWTSGEMIEEWEQADVRIRLGSKLVPPKRAIVDRIRRNLQKLSMDNPEKKKLRAVTQSIRHAKAHRVVYDKYKMSCCIRFCWEYCSYCHEIGHIFSECERVSEERIDQHMNRMDLNKH